MWKKTAGAKPSLQAQNASAPEPARLPNTIDATPVVAPVTPAPTVVSSASFLQPPSTIPKAPESPAPAPPRAGLSTISDGLKVRGDFTGTSDLTIDGELQGKIRLPEARVMVGSHGRVRADIEAREILVEGKVSGNLKAANGVRFGSSARFQGSVLTPRIGIDEGARFHGKVEMTNVAVAPLGSADLLPQPDSLHQPSSQGAGQESHA
jgi:cytoskeletal protein CcmA (bactofilin family)